MAKDDKLVVNIEFKEQAKEDFLELKQKLRMEAKRGMDERGEILMAKYNLKVYGLTKEELEKAQAVLVEALGAITEVVETERNIGVIASGLVIHLPEDETDAIMEDIKNLR